MEILVEKLNNYSKFGIPQSKRNHDEDIEECKILFYHFLSVTKILVLLIKLYVYRCTLDDI